MKAERIEDQKWTNNCDRRSCARGENVENKPSLTNIRPGITIQHPTLGKENREKYDNQEDAPRSHEQAARDSH